jgi:vancomycin resistance protein YoaR
MTTDKLDALEPTEGSGWAGPVEPTRRATPSSPKAAMALQSVSARAAASTRAAGKAARTALRERPLLAAFLVGGVAALLLGAAAAFASSTPDGRIASGVHAGSVDLSGLTRDEATTALKAAYLSLENGTITISTPQGSGTIYYHEIGRGADIEAMVDAAMAVGRYADPLTSTVERVRASLGGQSIPVAVTMDPVALSAKLRVIAGATQIEPVNASVTVTDTAFTVVPGSLGRGIDESAVASSILARLSDPNAPAEIEITAAYADLEPQVTTADAQAAVEAGQRMIVDVPLMVGTKAYPIPAATVRSWIAFGWRSDGSYGPAVDPAQVEAYIGGLAESKVNIDPIQPKFDWNQTTGELTTVDPGKAGRVVDVSSTSIAVAWYLDALAEGRGVVSSLQMIVNTVQPRLGEELTTEALTHFVKIGQGDVYFYPIESNGFGANIRTPAQIFDGQVIWPGETFSFWDSIGPVDEAHGFRKGGVIRDGKSDFTGAIGGGICSASTTMFNAAASSGLQIVERHPHFYWIYRYPLGRDATVYSNGVPGQGADLKWRNDTEYPIIIKSWWTGGNRATSKNWIHIQFWSMPTGRTVTWSKPIVANVVKATDTTIYVSTLSPGVKYRQEYPTEGKDVSITRTVTDTTTGAVIWTNTWKSHYTKVDGILQIGRTHTPAPTPTPGPTETPVITPEPAPTTAPSTRRKLR